MLRNLFSLFVVAQMALPVAAQHQHSPGASEKPATLVEGMGNLHRPVSTKVAEAQRFFDQGLTYVYAFNHDAAIRSFRRAAELDPQLAMAHWGIALALGPNINLDVDPEREKAAYEAVQKAKELAAGASELERAYIDALTTRYSIAPDADLRQLAVDYSKAMAELSKKYPDDLDAATLYAESLMDLRPWALWTSDGKPAEGTEEIVRTLESVMKRDPNHIGANHYYVHAVEASPTPERALASAERLKTLVPAAGHLVHMPAHIYIRTGDYAQAAKANEIAAAADRAFFDREGAQGVYPVMYYNHNLHFLAAAHAMDGNYAQARKAAEDLLKSVGPVVSEMPMLDGVPAVGEIIMVRFSKWKEILEGAQPPGGPVTKSLHHYARGTALSALGRIKEAEAELKSLRKTADLVPPDQPYMLNKAADIVAIADTLLDAAVARSKKDNKRQIELLEIAVAAQDRLNYDEPSDWLFPIRETLGGALLMAGEHERAERVFRDDLDRNPRNPRSLYGLSHALRNQKKNYAADAVEREYRKAWQRADVSLRVEDL